MNVLCALEFISLTEYSVIFPTFGGNYWQQKMSSSAIDADGDALDLVCQLDNVQGIVDALTSVRWKRHQVFLALSHSLSHYPG